VLPLLLLLPLVLLLLPLLLPPLLLLLLLALPLLLLPPLLLLLPPPLLLLPPPPPLVLSPLVLLAPLLLPCATMAVQRFVLFRPLALQAELSGTYTSQYEFVVTVIVNLTDSLIVGGVTVSTGHLPCGRTATANRLCQH
jgi:hypothetical protein